MLHHNLYTPSMTFTIHSLECNECHVFESSQLTVISTYKMSANISDKDIPKLYWQWDILQQQY